MDSRQTRMTVWMAVLCFSMVGCGDRTATTGNSLGERYSAAMREPKAETRATTLISLAADQSQAGDTAGASTSLAEAAKAAGDVRPLETQARLLVRVASAYARGGESAPAKKTLAKAEQAALKVEEPAAKADALARVASAYARSLKQTTKAIAVLEETQKAAGGIEDGQSRVAAYCSIARVFSSLGKQAEVNRAMAFATEIAKSLDTPKRQSDSLAAVAAEYAAMNETKKSIAMLDAALDRVPGVEDDYVKVFALATIAEQYGKAGQRAKANELLGAAEQLAERIRDRGLKQEAAGRVRTARAELK